MSQSIPPTSAPQTCFASNPDIAGIGVRAATYFQALLLFVTTFIFVFDGFVDSHERRVLKRTYKSLLLIACALLLSLIVQATTSELSVYHAFIVLNLCWMLIANALVICVLPTIDAQIEEGWRKWIGSFWPSRSGQLQAFTFVSVLLSALGGIGLWMWANPMKFSASVQCTEQVVIYVFLAPLSPTHPRLRIASIVVYAIAATPIVNTVIFTAIAVIVVNFINGFIPRAYTFGRLYRITASVELIMNALLIASTEMTVRRNKSLVNEGRMHWGFGQILVLLLGVAPILAAIDVMARKISSNRWRLRMARLDYWFRRSLKKNDEPLGGINKRINQHLNSVFTFLETQPDVPELTAIRLSLTTARAFLAAAIKGIEKSRVIQEVDAEAFSPAQIIPSESFEDAAAEVGKIHERVSAACDLRFADVQDPMLSLVTKANLEATRDALGAAKRALDAYCTCALVINSNGS